MHLAIHPARSGVPAHSKALLSHHGEIPQFITPRIKRHTPEPVLNLRPEPHHKIRRYIPQEQKYAEMRARMARLKEKGMLA
jgi:hypothetical protein